MPLASPSSCFGGNSTTLFDSLARAIQRSAISSVSLSLLSVFLLPIRVPVFLTFCIFCVTHVCHFRFWNLFHPTSHPIPSFYVIEFFVFFVFLASPVSLVESLEAPRRFRMYCYVNLNRNADTNVSLLDVIERNITRGFDFMLNYNIVSLKKQKK